MTVLSLASSTNAGADLWIIPPLEESLSAARLDWYLNFQLSRSARKQPRVLGGEVVNLLRQCGLPEVHFPAPDPVQLMIPSSEFLPNRWVVQIGEPANLQRWCQRVIEIWTGLRKPSLRVFLPTGLSAVEFSELWKQSQSFDDFSVVIDETPTKGSASF